jgi:hypothetical protein
LSLVFHFVQKAVRMGVDVVSTSHQAQSWGVMNLLSSLQTSMWCTTLSWWMYMATPGASRKSSSSSSVVAGGVQWPGTWAWFGMDQIWWGVGQIYTSCKMQPKNGDIILNDILWLSLLVLGTGMSTAAAR